MSFIRKIRRGKNVYLAEVENRWIDGKCIQKHIRYIGREVDGETVLASSLSNVEVDEVKLYGPLLVLDTIARKIGLHSLLGEYNREILSLVYAHCLDYKSINKMEQWFSRTDLSLLLSLENVTERHLLEGLDSLETQDSQLLQRSIFQRVVQTYDLSVSGIIYDVTNTYLYGRRCSFARLGHDKEGIKGRPLIQIGLAVTKNHGIPICHKVLDGNIHDAKMFADFVTELRKYRIRKGMVVYDRGIASGENIADVRKLGWDVLCGLPIKGKLEAHVRSLIAGNQFVDIQNRVRLRKTIFYVVARPYRIEGISGTVAVCFNDQLRKDIRESRYDEIKNAEMLLAHGKQIKKGLEKYFDRKGRIKRDILSAAEEFDGYSCIFATARLNVDEMVRHYFDKDLVEKAFRTLKGITNLRPIRHWLYNRVTAHVFICYLSYLLLSLLQYHIDKLDISAEDALIELETMYKVYLRDVKKGFSLSRVVTLSKRQEQILKAVNKRLVKI
jgi:transposase